MEILDQIKNAAGDNPSTKAQNVINVLSKAAKEGNFDYFKKYGKTPKQIFDNMYTIIKAVGFGYDKESFHISRYGGVRHDTLQMWDLLKAERISLAPGLNSITIAVGPNGKASFGYAISLSKAGSSDAPWLIPDPYDNREECLKAAIKHYHAVLDKMTREGADLSKKDIKLVENLREKINDLIK